MTLTTVSSSLSSVKRVVHKRDGNTMRIVMSICARDDDGDDDDDGDIMFDGGEERRVEWCGEEDEGGVNPPLVYSPKSC
jgi:hypothetical protein